MVLLLLLFLVFSDFGFARALGPEDLKNEKIAPKKRGSVNFHDIDGSIADGKKRNGSVRVSVDTSRRSSSSKNGLDQSISHRFKRSMSALGNRLYAAPVKFTKLYVLLIWLPFCFRLSSNIIQPHSNM